MDGDKQQRQVSGGSRGHLIWPWLALLAFVFLWARTAWIGDDAFITLRTVDNFTQGYGLRWNVAERVQTFTHPLWMLLLSVPYSLTRSAEVAVHSLGLFCTVGALMVLLLRVAQDRLIAAALLLWLGGSKAFVDFSSSGLENPLSHLLLAWIFWQGLRVSRAGTDGDPEKADRARLALLLGAGFLGTNRMDLCVLVAPLVAWALWPTFRCSGFWPATRRALLGFSPLLLWMAFAVVYFGSPFPITAYAKLGTGIPAADLAAQGLRYFEFLWWFDPLTAVGILLALLLGWGRGLATAALLGVVLYLGYIVKVGGDFMGTRFFAAPLFVSVLVLASRSHLLTGFLPKLRVRWKAGTVGVAGLALAFLSPLPTWTAGPDYGDRSEALQFCQRDGIVDERGYWWRWGRTGLWSNARVRLRPNEYGPLLAGVGEGRGVTTALAVGIQGYVAGPRVYLVDPLLCDPFLARLPVRNPESWRVGHFLREMPAGYLDTWAAWARGESVGAGPEPTRPGTGEGWRAPVSWPNKLKDPGLRRCYEHLRAVWSGPIWSGSRWAAMISLWLGHGRDEVSRYVREDYRDPQPTPLPWSELGDPSLSGTPWFLAPIPVLPPGGYEIELPSPYPPGALPQGAKVQLGLAGGSVTSPELGYRLTWIGPEGPVATSEVAGPLDPQALGGLLPVTVVVPAEVGRSGLSRLLVAPAGRLKHHMVGWIAPL